MIVPTVWRATRRIWATPALYPAHPHPSAKSVQAGGGQRDMCTIQVAGEMSVQSKVANQAGVQSRVLSDGAQTSVEPTL